MNCKIKLIEEEDADFIVKLRNNPKLNRYLNPTSSNVVDQIKWIKITKLKKLIRKNYIL